MEVRRNIYYHKTILMVVVLYIVSTFYTYSQHIFDANKNYKISFKELKLSNGFTVILNEDHTESKIFGVVITKAGGKNDPKDATGMAHYQEHMLFKGTQDLGTTNWEKEKPHIDKIFELYDLLGKTRNTEERKKIQQQINDESLLANEFVIPNELSNIIKGIGGTLSGTYAF
jgi:zinc protease